MSWSYYSWLNILHTVYCINKYLKLLKMFSIFDGPNSIIIAKISLKIITIKWFKSILISLWNNFLRHQKLLFKAHTDWNCCAFANQSFMFQISAQARQRLEFYLTKVKIKVGSSDVIKPSAARFANSKIYFDLLPCVLLSPREQHAQRQDSFELLKMEIKKIPPSS